MGVYIKDMEMPDNCALCPMWDAGNCLVATEAIICEYNKRPSDCPLVPVPPHGRLIDADALSQMFDPDESFGAAVLEIIADTPTIIPAEESET